MDQMMQLGQMAIEPALAAAGWMIAESALWLSLSLLFIALIDAPYQKYSFTKRMRMTKQEVIDEMKDMEGRPEVKQQITQFQDEQIEAEFAQAVEEHRVEEIYWVGGEPLMYEQHWRYMRRIIELGDGQRVYARYNTNLSRVDYGGSNLYRDILSGLRDWQICASLDGTGIIGEYIRTGLDYPAWLENFKQGVSIARHPRQMRIDFTLTLPGMFEVENITQLAQELQVDILAKVVFSFTPDIVMSPLALPRNILDPWLTELIDQTSGAMQSVLTQLRSRPTFEEQWPNTYLAGIKKGKKRIFQLEKIRKDVYTIINILTVRPAVI
jgi:hypothetical protein